MCNTTDEILEKVTDIAAETLGLEHRDIRPESDIENDLGADSLDAAWLITELEDTFGFTVTDEEDENLHTIGDIVSLVSQKMAGDISDHSTLPHIKIAGDRHPDPSDNEEA